MPSVEPKLLFVVQDPLSLQPALSFATGPGRALPVRKRNRLGLVLQNGFHLSIALGFLFQNQDQFVNRCIHILPIIWGSDLTVLTPGWDDLFKALNSGRGDIIAASLTITDERRKQVDFSSPYLEIQQLCHCSTGKPGELIQLRSTWTAVMCMYDVGDHRTMNALEHLRRQGINVKIHAESQRAD